MREQVPYLSTRSSISLRSLKLNGKCLSPTSQASVLFLTNGQLLILLQKTNSRASITGGSPHITETSFPTWVLKKKNQQKE